jgi:hypothetical protein
MNLGEMRLDVRDRIGERTANFWSDEFINRKLNQAQLRFAREEKWTWLYAVQVNIPVPVNTMKVELMDGIDWTRHFGLTLYRDGSDIPILPKRVSPLHGRNHRQQEYTTGEPRYWFPSTMVKNTYESGDPSEWAHVAELVPAADQAYTAEVYFMREPTKMVADEDECDLPEAYQEAVVAWATAQCWLKDLNGGRKAQEEFNLYNTVLDQAKQDHLALAAGESVTWGGDDIRDVPTNWLHRMLFHTPLGG